MSLADRAMLLSLTISCWNGRVGLTVDEAIHKGLDPERDSIQHQVVPKSSLIGLQRHARYIRSIHHRHTVPWDNNGLRLIPSNRFFKYRETIKPLQDVYNERVAIELPRLVNFIEPKFVEYKTGLEHRFGSHLSIYAVPDTGMPALNDIVQAEIRDACRTAIEADVQSRHVEAIKQVGELFLKKCVQYDRTAFEPGNEKYEELRENLNLLANTLRSLVPESTVTVINAITVAAYLKTL